MNTLLAGLVILIMLVFVIHLLSLAKRLVNATEKIAYQVNKITDE